MTKMERLEQELAELKNVCASLQHDEDVIADLRNEVEALKREAAAAAAAAREVVRPVGMDGDAQATKRERDAHEAWRRSRGYGERPAIQVTLESAGDEWDRQVASALQAERDVKQAHLDRQRLNAERRAANAATEPDQFQRAAAGAQHSRDVEAARRTRMAPIVEEALAPVGTLS